MTEMKTEPIKKYCKGIPTLSRLAEKFVFQEDDFHNRSNDMMTVLQHCLDTLEAYRDVYKKLKMERDGLTESELFEIYEAAYIYYKIVHINILNKLPNLQEFQTVKRQSNSNDQKLMEIYNMLVKSLLNDDKIAQIKHFLREHCGPESSGAATIDNGIEKDSKTFDSGTFISVDQLKHLLFHYNDSTLLLDIRPRAEFNKKHINFKNIVCIEPISFKSDYTDIDVEKRSLITSPQKEIDLFRNRTDFEFIVLYTSEPDERNKSNHNYQQEMVLLDLFMNRSFGKPLRADSKIFVLKAGISNWISNNGDCITEIDDKSGDQLYLNGRNSTLRFQSLPDHSPSISASMDGSMKEMLSESPNNGFSAFQRHQQQPPPAGFKNMFSSSLTSLSSKLPCKTSIIDHSSGSDSDVFTHYPETPHLLAEEKGKKRIVNHGHISPISSRALTSISKHSISAQPPRIYTNNKGFLNQNTSLTSSATISKPPTQPIPLLPQLPMQDSSKSHTTQHTEKYDLDFTVGLENMGNSCYISCIVQCLLGTHELTNIFLNNSYEKHINLNSRLGSKGVLAKFFARLIHTMHQQGAFKLKEKGKAVKPIQFKMACGSINSLFKGSGQQDCQEFCQFLLDGLHEDLNQCGNNPPLKELSPDAEKMRERLSMRIASSIEWERFLTTDFSVIVDLFQGQYASQLCCKVCGLTSTTYQPFTVLSVPVPHVKSCTIEDCFNEFTKTEELETDEQWSCSTCKKKQPSTKKLTITRLPRNLVIHLKRFDNMLNKNNVFVEYPFLLDLTSYWASDFDGRLPPGVTDELPTRGQIPPFTYKLYAVASHSGSLYGGHYTAYVDKGINRGWYYFDDTNCRPVRTKTECITSNAYVLFYHRVYGI
ncbi:hypothetical protein HG535_0B01390 [Zygotorulaspora mrakii]|uniref:Ubiquitin carboxyl-terminal hydrolase n=1 Tax=Zygotorulaspora mrakii TaxID=42260 RepID=A0A7H9AXT2_ZYGMR|nr:uncharacterized protein HG535_0B01390 [Zygotorulaspora mrakii]QLG71101.1 hypothetical protein HG535_0B01390 [Zygotorulaspora mrakii]